MSTLLLSPAEKIAFAAKVVEDFRAAIQRKNPNFDRPDASTVGTQLREVIEAEIGRTLSCSDCLGYLKKLNKTDQHDHDEIVQYLSAQFPWPVEWREKNTRRREAISALIEPVIARKHGYGPESSG